MPRSLTTHIDSPAEVGRRLRKSREAKELSQRQLAFPGCTAAYISRLEGGFRVPSLQMIRELARRLDVDPAWLATGEPGREAMETMALRDIALIASDTLGFGLVALTDDDRERLARWFSGLGAFTAPEDIALAGKLGIIDPEVSESVQEALDGLRAVNKALTGAA